MRVGIECVSAGPEAGHLEKFCWFCDTEDESVATQTKRCLVVSSALIRAGRARRNGLTCTTHGEHHERQRHAAVDYPVRPSEVHDDKLPLRGL